MGIFRLALLMEMDLQLLWFNMPHHHLQHRRHRVPLGQDRQDRGATDSRLPAGLTERHPVAAHVLLARRRRGRRPSRDGASDGPAGRCADAGRPGSGANPGHPAGGR